MLLLTFGSIVAAGLPFATALFGLGISSGVTGLLAALIDVPDWAPALPRCSASASGSTTRC